MFNFINESHAKAMVIKVLEHYQKMIPDKKMPVKSYGDDLYTAEELLHEINTGSDIGRHLVWESIFEIIEKDLDKMKEQNLPPEYN